MKKVFTLIAYIAIISSPMAKSQNTHPAENHDYELTIETENHKDGYTVYSCYLRNRSPEKLLFYNFRMDTTHIVEVIHKLPEGVVILEPHRNALIFRGGFRQSEPAVSWNSEFMRHSAGFNKFPEKYKNYIFYWNSEKTGETVTYTYLLKNISIRRIKFYDFMFEGEPDEMVRDLPNGSVITEPGQEMEVARFRMMDGGSGPYLKWSNVFATFQPNNDPFCEGVTFALEASRDDGFSPIRGSNAEITGGVDLKIAGTENLMITGSDGSGSLTLRIGGEAEYKEIKKRFREYQEKIGFCIPGSLEETETKNKSDKSAKVEYEGVIDSMVHRLSLTMRPVKAGSDIFELVVEISEAK